MTQQSAPQTQTNHAGSGEESALAGLVVTQTVRVAVKRSARDGELIVARLLEGSSPPPGTRQALLVLLDPNEDLTQPKL